MACVKRKEYKSQHEHIFASHLRFELFCSHVDARGTVRTYAQSLSATSQTSRPLKKIHAALWFGSKKPKANSFSRRTFQEITSRSNTKVALCFLILLSRNSLTFALSWLVPRELDWVCLESRLFFENLLLY